MEGWIKYHRSFRDHWLYKTNKPKTRREAWEDILLLVNYEAKKVFIRGQLYDCDRGQALFSLENWASEFNWTVQQVRTFFKLLEKDKMITTEGMQYTTRLTVCNYESYQGLITDEQQAKQQTNNIPLTDEQQAANKPLTTTKEDKEDKEIKKIKNKRNKEEESGNPISHPPKTIEERTKKLYEEIAAFSGTYPKEMLRSFFNYWSEKTRDGKKLKFEKEETWELEKRLQTWQRNEEKFNPKANSTTQQPNQPVLPYYKKFGQK